MNSFPHDRHVREVGLSACDMRGHLESLRAERALALIADPAPEQERVERIADLDAEIAIATSAYVGMAVTELATLRGELSGRLAG